MARFSLLLAGLVALAPASAFAGSCADMVSAYQDQQAELSGLVPPIFDGYDVGSGQQLNYDDGHYTATLSCTSDGDIWNFELSTAFPDPNARARASVGFAYALQALASGLDPSGSLSSLMLAAGRNMEVDGDKATGQASTQLGADYTAQVGVEDDTDGSGSMTVWITPVQQ